MVNARGALTHVLLRHVLPPATLPFPVARAITGLRLLPLLRLHRVLFGSHAFVGATRSLAAPCPFPIALQKRSSCATVESQVRGQRLHVPDGATRQRYPL